MTDNTHKNNFTNLPIIALLAIIFLYTAYIEGYFGIVSLLFGGTLFAGFLITIWLALKVSTKRLLACILSIFVIEYIKESTGIRTGLWKYNGIDGNYLFGVWSWVLVGLVSYTLSTRVVIRQIRKLNLTFPVWLNCLLLTLLSLLIPLTIGSYSKGVDAFFIVFYSLLFVTGIYFSFKMDFAVFAGIIITACILSFPSEYSGSMGSGVWTYTYHPNYPPVFLIFGCWPLEILVQYILSAHLSSEALDKYTFNK
jgi:hypothetical protein